jgi:UPF0755 protein
LDNDKNWKKEQMKIKLLERQSEARVVRKIVTVSLVAVILVMALVGLGGYLYISSALKPVDPDNKDAIKVEIPRGSGISLISQTLEDNGVVKNAKVFKYYVKFKNESGFQAGTYNLSPSMTIQEIIDQIKNGIVAETYRITIPEGRDLEQISEIIAKKTGKKSKDVLAVINKNGFIKEMMKKYPDLLTDDILAENIRYPLEGYLYPATYSFYEEDPTIESIVSEMVKKTNEILAKYKDEMSKDKWTPHTLLTMASLIEEEATEKVDRDKISAVFKNRMEKDMRLQTDPTVLYALGEHKDRVTYKDLEVDSPYNLYRHKGLTPGPIANAGETSIQAALNPADIDDLYFLATKSGEVIFNKTLEEHNKDKAKHITNN